MKEKTENSASVQQTASDPIHTPGMPNDPNDLYHLMRSCGHILYHNGMNKSGQGRILHILEQEGSLAQKDLQTILKIKSGSVSEILTKLEKDGLIVRTRDERDRRRMIVSMTEEGRKHAQDFHERAEKKNWFYALSEEEQAQLRTILQKLLAAWYEE